MPTGRKPTLTVVSGTGKPHRSNDALQTRLENEPKGCSSELKPPRELSKGARKEWKRVVALYKQLNGEVLNDLDAAVLAAYCESVAIFRAAEVEYQKMPLIGRSTRTGATIENPYLRIMNREGQNLAKLAEQLCLSPVGRARIGIAKARNAEAQDPMDEILIRRMRRDV